MLRMQVQNTPLQKSYELNVGVQTFSVEFRGANRQFDCLEIPLFYNDSLRWSCNACSKAPYSEYANYPIFQELTDEDTYFSDSNEQIYLDMDNSKGYRDELENLKRDDSDLLLKLELKNAVENKFHLRVLEYSQGDYLYLLGNRELTIKYEEYTIAKEKHLAS